MASEDDPTKALLEKLVSDLLGAAASDDAKEAHLGGGSYLIAEDKQFLGKITANIFDTESILNQYGPYGSSYSPTSIFNNYSQYGGQYGQFSPENPYTSTPPSLIIRDRLVGKVSVNNYVSNRIPFDAFVGMLKNDMQSLLSGRLSPQDIQTRALPTGDTVIQAADGTYLGSLNPNRFDTNSIFNPYGQFGNKFSRVSIFNKFSPYGGKYSPLSPFNDFSRNPPEILRGGQRLAFLTTNPSFRPRVDPADIIDWSERNVGRRVG